MTDQPQLDASAGPVQHDGSGRWALAPGPDGHPCLLKRFDHPRWRDPERRLALRLTLWRLDRLEAEALGGWRLLAEGGGEVPAGHRPPVEGLPLSALGQLTPEACADLLAGLLLFLAKAHQAGAVGLRFRAEAIVPLGGREWAWLAPDLQAPDPVGESAEREDQRELAKAFSAWTHPPLLSPVSQALGALLSPVHEAQEAWAQAAQSLGLALPTPRRIAPLPVGPWVGEREALGAWFRRTQAEHRVHLVALSHDPGVDPEALLTALRGDLQVPMRSLPARGAAAFDAVCAWVGWDGAGLPPERPGVEARRALAIAWMAALKAQAEAGPMVLVLQGVDPKEPWWAELLEVMQRAGEGLSLLVILALDPSASPPPQWPNSHLRRFRPEECEAALRGLLPTIPLAPSAIALAQEISQGAPVPLMRLAQHWLATGFKADPAHPGTWLPREKALRPAIPEEARAVVEVVATLGGQAPWGQLAAVLDVPEAHRWEALSKALEGGWLRESATGLALWGPDEAERVLAAAKPTERERWHRRVATLPALGPVRRASHALLGGLAPVVPRAALAARPSLAALGADQALGQLLQSAWNSVDPSDPLRPALAEARFRSCLAAGAANEALGLAETPLQRALALAALGRPEEAEALAPPEGPGPGGEVWLAIAWAQAQAGALDLAAQSLAKAGPPPEEPSLAARAACLRARLRPGAGSWAEALAAAQGAGLSELALAARLGLAEVHLAQGQAAEAAELLEEALAAAALVKLDAPPRALELQAQALDALAPPMPPSRPASPTQPLAPARPSATSSLPGTRGALRALLRAESEAQGDMLAQLEAVLGLVASRQPQEVLLDRLATTFARIGRVERAWVYLADEEGHLRLRHRLGEGGQEPPPALREALAGRGRPLHAPEGSRHLELKGLAGPAGAVLAVPLVARDSLAGNRLLGLLYGDRDQAWVGPPGQASGLLELMARHVGVALEAALLEDEAMRRAHRLEALLSLSNALATALEFDEVAALALSRCMAATRAEQAYLFLGEDLPCRASLGLDGQILTTIEASRSVLAQVQREGRSLALLDVPNQSDLDPKASLVTFKVKAVLAVPIQREDRVEGVIYLSCSSATKTFGRQDLELVEAMAGQIALGLQAARAFAAAKEANLGLEAKVQARTAELESAYRELSEAQDQLLETEKLATVGSLAAGVAHEINNPLGAILSNAQLLLMDATDEEQREGLSLIEAGARRCQAIVEALRRYARPPSAERLAVDLGQMAQEVLDFLEGPLQQVGVQVQCQVPAGVPPVLGDATELRQLVTQLVLNALDALREADVGQGARLLVALERRPEGIALLVGDNGPGISPEHLRRIFDPFFTTKAVGSATGLGLSLAQRIAEKHGGRLSVHSRLGHGATFTLLLPAP